MKHVIITGGVTSSLGKGVTAATIGKLLAARGYKIKLQKFDPYLNTDLGLMDVSQHGEIFITQDGAETDLDLGHYERIAGVTCNRNSNITAGRIYWDIRDNEAKGFYNGGTIQVIPTVTNEIKKRFSGKESDILITEIGGTVGDIEGLPFLEAARQLGLELEKDEVVFVHVTLLPTLTAAGEVKTKPTQHSVKELRSLGIQPDVLVCRTEKSYVLSEDLKKKLSLFCDVKPSAIIETPNLQTIYELPKILHDEGLDEVLLKKLNLPLNRFDLGTWQDIGFRIRCLAPATKTVAVITNYELKDVHLSLTEALTHAMLSLGTQVNIQTVLAEELREWHPTEQVLDCYDGIIITDNFDIHDTTGQQDAIAWSMLRQAPCLCIGLGFRALVERAAGNVFVTGEPIVKGSFKVHLIPFSKAKQIYGVADIEERFHNKEHIDPAASDKIRNSLVISGTTANYEPVLVEDKDHPFLIGCQYLPFFESYPEKPNPLIKSFLEEVLR